jgi:cellulose synthase/poly-beta-1,6-N-acetylglucosamine synthase-like glycosyltransferase
MIRLFSGGFLISHFFFGTSIYTAILGIFVLIVVVGDFTATAITVLYIRVLYPRLFKKRFDETYLPSCAIILPCKGIPKDLKQNLAAFLELDYPNYTIIFALESKNDAAYPIISSLIEHKPNASIVIAGFATECAQKNYNLLAAIRESHNPDVYVFADADISPGRHWLKDLILPLSSQKITVSTGFRWLISKKGSLGDLTHVYINIFLFVGLTFVNLTGKTFLWGGSMAIRRKDFEDLKVADVWSHTVVDDNSLSQILLVNARKAMVVPGCVTESDDLLPSISRGIAWFSRQIMFCKAHQRPLWKFGVIPTVVATFSVMLWLPLSIIISMSTGIGFLTLGGGASIVFFAGELLTVLWYPLMGPMPRFYKFVAAQPLLRVTHIISPLKTVFATSLVWSGARYHLNKKGKVTQVERLMPEDNPV